MEKQDPTPSSAAPEAVPGVGALLKFRTNLGLTVSPLKQQL
jgi:hypothetical protein